MLSDILKIRISSVVNPICEYGPRFNNIKNIDVSSLRVQYKDHVVINRPKSIVEVRVFMSYYLKETLLFSGQLTTCFDVLDLKQHIIVSEDNKFRVDNDFLPTLISVAFGLARGYFWAENQSTVLSSFPFPMISIENIKKRTTYNLI